MGAERRFKVNGHQILHTFLINGKDKGKHGQCDMGPGWNGGNNLSSTYQDYS